MTKGQRQEILHIIHVLYETHEKIVCALEKNDTATVQSLLLECQEKAIGIGNRIETSEGERFITVSYLEEYCECVYQLYAGQFGMQEAKRMLNEVLKCVKDSVLRDIPIRREVVFLPYKASMWDSLESAWSEAKADKESNVYVIPIPYYDKNPDGSFREMHYEGEQYPENVEVTDWKNYSIEERRPDEIYIHNPYDAANRVTSVEPRFYASNLKKYTDKLVYIPYFVLEEIRPDEHEKINAMKHFCLLPGVIHATQVIVQSENMRQIYINELMAAFRKNRIEINRKYLEDRIIGAGSPKIAKALHTKKDEVQIPADWVKIIQRPDGSWKKVLFYNTGVNALLSYGERWLKKIEYVFDEFKACQEEIAFLWRPHPLTRATIIAQMPHVLTRYSELEERYREEGWGIYDDTANLNRAIAISDIFYGDKSSISRLFEENRKKVILQNVDICNTHTKNLIDVYDIIGENGKKYFTSKHRNGLFCYHSATGSAELLQRFQTKGIEEDFLYMVGYQVNNLVIFAPYVADNLAIYDLKEKKMQYLYDGRLNAARIIRIIEYQKKLFLINESSIARSFVLDMEHMELLKLSEAYGLQEEALDKISIRYYRDICVVEDSFYIPGEENDCVIEFNMKEGSVRVHRISSSDITYATIAHDGNAFWLAGDQNTIVRWDGANGTETLCELPAGFMIHAHKTVKDYFACSLYINGYVYIFPLIANMIIRVNVSSKEIEVVRDGLEERICWCAKKWSEDSIFVQVDSYEGEVVRESFILNMHNECIAEDCLRVREQTEREKLKEVYFKNTYIVKETSEMEVMDLL